MIDYIRVTDILYPFSGLTHIPSEILKNAAERGTKVHEIADSLIKDLGSFGTDETVRGYIESLELWLPGKKFIDKPDRFYDDQYALTGECDAIYDDNGLVLVDFKTPAKESRSWMLQGSAYSYLAKKAGYDIKRIEFVKLDKTGKMPKSYFYQENFDLFLGCLKTYSYFYKNGKDVIDIQDL